MFVLLSWLIIFYILRARNMYTNTFITQAEITQAANIT